MEKKYNSYKNKKSGFTLVETFVAIVILMVAVIGPMTLFSRSISDGVYARNQVTASYLAQEGLEIVINRRDNNIRNNVDWLEGLNDCVTGLCYFVDTATAYSCPSGDCPVFNLSNQGEYLYDLSLGSTIFSRDIMIETLGQGDEARVMSKVSWNNKGVPRTFTATSLIFNLSSPIP